MYFKALAVLYSSPYLPWLKRALDYSSLSILAFMEDPKKFERHLIRISKRTTKIFCQDQPDMTEGNESFPYAKLNNYAAMRCSDGCAYAATGILYAARLARLRVRSFQASCADRFCAH